METVRLTVAEALVKYLAAQKIQTQESVEPLFGCAFAIFGHGNVPCLGQQLLNHQAVFPTWRGQNEQSMALAAIAYAKANKRQRIGIATMLDPADCGPAFIGLPQDVQGYTFDFPVCFFEEKIHRIRRPQPEMVDLEAAAEIIRRAKQPVIIAGGGVFYSHATAELQAFAEQHQIPVVETIAGRSCLTWDHPLNCGPIGPTGSDSANALAAEADVVIAIGTRLQDFVTGSWSAFRNEAMQLISINTGRFDAHKHRALPIIGDAKASITPLTELLGDYQTDASWQATASQERSAWLGIVEARTAATDTALPSYAQIIGQVNKLAADNDRIVTAAGGLPAELNMNWLARSRGNFDIEFGFSCMGYEVAGGWGASIACPDNDVIVLVGDGSYLIMNSDIYSSVLTGHKMIVIVCDNAGFAVINKLQKNTGNDAFNNQLRDCTTVRKQTELPRVDFAKHAESLGAHSEKIGHLNDFAAAFARAKAADRTAVIVVDIDETQWSSVDAWWEVGLPQVSDKPLVQAAMASWDEGRQHQRKGV